MHSINWLKPKVNWDKVPITFNMVLSLIFLGLAILWPAQMFAGYGLAFLAAIIFLIVLSRRSWGLYWLAAVSFFHGWEISLDKYSWARHLQFISSLNAPLVDFIGVVVLSGTLLMLFLGVRKLDKYWHARLRWPVIFYGAFLVWALIASSFAYNRSLDVAFKYWLRFLLFNGMVFLILPTWLANKKAEIEKVVKIWLGVGVLVSLFGLSSLFVLKFTGWPSVTPYAIGSFAPLGTNHNLIAEVLVAIVPVGWYLAMKAKTSQAKRWLWAATGLIAFTALFTLSRAAWLSLGLEAVLLGYYYRAQVLEWWNKAKFLWIILLVILGGYMLLFLNSKIVASSTTARLEGVEMSLFYAARSPWWGFGPGSYVLIAGDTAEIIQEYGDALDAHGWVQKVIVEEGWGGLVLWMVFLASILWQLWKRQSEAQGDDLLLARSLFVMSSAAIFFQLFNTSYFNSVMWLPLGIALAAAKSNE